MTERNYTTEICMDIIAKIKERPEMWNSLHPLHKKRPTHKKFWLELSKDMGVEETILRKRWKHLKDQYRKELRRTIDKGIPEKEIAWQYFEYLHFLKEELLRDKSFGIQSPGAAADSEDESDDDEAEKGVARKVRIVEAKTDMIYNGLMETKAAIEERMTSSEDNTRHDPDYMYLMSLLPSLRQLNEIQKLQFKGKINDWLLEAYLEQCDTKYIVADVPHLQEQKPVVD